MEQNETPVGTNADQETNHTPVCTSSVAQPTDTTVGTNCDTSPIATLPDPVPAPEAARDKAQADEGETLRDSLVRMVSEAGCELFHDRSSNTYVTVPIDDHKEHWRLRSDGFRRWMRHHYHRLTGHGIGTSVIADAMDTLDAIAAYSDQEHPVHIRTAHHGTDIYIDLCDDQWRAIHISANGWKITEAPPVRFVRTKGMQPLPVPVPGGSIDALRPLINAPTDDIWCLIVAWILATFSQGPFPVLVLLGEQGSSKSFCCRVIRRLIDPSEIEVTSSPKEARDVIMAANNSHVLALDNLSGIPIWLSDLLCGIATGAAHRERKYHTNNGDEELFRVKRPIVLNGIDFAMRDDLLSRSFLVTLPVILDENRQDETELWTAINNATSSILGGICDALSSILKKLPTTKLATLPRMADAALWVTAAEESLGWPQGHFMDLYGGNRDRSAELALESDSFGLALHQFMIATQQTECLLTWQELVSSLGNGQNQFGWPKNSKAVATRLTRLAPALRHVAIHWQHERVNGKRYYKIWTDVADVAT
ncbi:ATP-binding protein [soil metagenome]